MVIAPNADLQASKERPGEESFKKVRHEPGIVAIMETPGTYREADSPRRAPGGLAT